MSELHAWRGRDLNGARIEDPVPDARNSLVAEPVRDAKVRIANAFAYREQVEAVYAAETREQPGSRETRSESEVISAEPTRPGGGRQPVAVAG